MKLVSFFVVLATLTFLTSCSSSNSCREYYEIRKYKIENAANKQKVLNYIANSYKPALKNMGLSNIGVFESAKDMSDHSVYMVIPFSCIEQYGNRSNKLFNDSEFMKSSKEFFSIPKDTPAYTRIESSFFKAFESIPTMEIPEFAKTKKPRIYEMRIYESHNEEKAMLKRDMFNVAEETQLMRDLGMGPVFFGECLSGHNAPNLTYFLSAKNFEQSKKYWDVFRKHPRWQVMKKLPRYKDTVSKIDVVFLKPVNCSDW